MPKRNVHFISGVGYCVVALFAASCWAAGPLLASTVPESFSEGGAVTEEMLMLGDPQQWARPRRVLKPDYPPELVKNGTGGRVDVELLLSKAGRVLEVKGVSSEPSNKELESAVSSVISKWTFSPAAWKGCAPVDGVANVRIWFEVRDGRGVVSTSGRSVQVQKTEARAGAPKLLNRAEVLGSVIYPSTTARRGIEGNVYIVLEIEGKTGKVQKAVASETVVYPETFDLAAEHFREAALESVPIARFAPMADKLYRVCMPFGFNLK